MMVTNFSDGNVSSKGFLITQKDTPTRVGDRISTISEMSSIPNPWRGMLVYVEDEGLYYKITSLKASRIGPLSIPDSVVDTYEVFEQGITENTLIIDSLESDNSEAALSARQGKLLITEINNLAEKLTNVYTFRGSKKLFSELPTENLIPGDVWNVEEAIDNHAPGTNWAWAGTEWDALAGSFDLSAYCTLEIVNSLIEAETIRASEKENELQLQVDELKTDISYNILQLEDLAEKVDSLGDLSIEQDLKVSDLEVLLLGEEERPKESILQLINNNSQDILTLQEETENLLMCIDLLNSDETVQGSIDNKISQAFEWIKI